MIQCWFNLKGCCCLPVLLSAGSNLYCLKVILANISMIYIMEIYISSYCFCFHTHIFFLLICISTFSFLLSVLFCLYVFLYIWLSSSVLFFWVCSFYHFLLSIFSIQCGWPIKKTFLILNSSPFHFIYVSFCCFFMSLFHFPLPTYHFCSSWSLITQPVTELQLFRSTLHTRFNSIEDILWFYAFVTY